MAARPGSNFHSFEEQEINHSAMGNAGSTSLASTSTRPPLHLVSQEGQLQVHTTNYRGSFSGVLSEAIRSAGLGGRVMIAQFLKGGVHQGTEGCVHLCDRLEWIRPAICECISKPAQAVAPNDSETNTQEEISKIWGLCRERIIKGTLDQLVLDEIGLAISLGYLQETDVFATLEKRPGAMDVILTGPSIPSRIMDMADQITELRCGF